MDMSAPNKALRDPVAFRCNLETPHHRTGTKYKVYPTYDCACPFVDAVEGVTHALRTSEYRDREAQYDWIQGAMRMRKVHIWDYSRLNFEFTTLSKRKLGWFVEAGLVDGWDDPRFPTVQGVVRRGLAVPALREFIISQGASRNLNTMTWEKLWTLNKRLIDPVCPRHTAVEASRVLLTLTNFGGAPESKAVPKHKKCAAAGDKTQWLCAAVWLDAADAAAVAVGEEVTLMDWGNVIIRAKTDATPDGACAGLSGELHLEGDFKKTKLKLTWLAHLPDVPSAQLVPLTLREFDHLITKRKVEDEDNIADLFNTKSAWSRAAFGDCNMGTLRKGDVIQLERKGYWICDAAPDVAAGTPAVLLSIPDGRESKPAASSNGAADGAPAKPVKDAKQALADAKAAKAAAKAAQAAKGKAAAA
jgi:glutamyl-tRNA synthetase